MKWVANDFSSTLQYHFAGAFGKFTCAIRPDSREEFADCPWLYLVSFCDNTSANGHAPTLAEAKRACEVAVLEKELNK